MVVTLGFPAAIDAAELRSPFEAPVTNFSIKELPCVFFQCHELLVD
jgi:hypothetical protein